MREARRWPRHPAPPRPVLLGGGRTHRACGDRKGGQGRSPATDPKPQFRGALGSPARRHACGAHPLGRVRGPGDPGRRRSGSLARHDSTPREGGADKGAGAARPAPDRPGHRAQLPVREAPRTAGTQDPPGRILRAAAAAVAKGGDARPERRTARNAAGRVGPLLRDPPPRRARVSALPPVEKPRAQPPPRKVHPGAAATPERQSDFFFGFPCAAGTSSGETRAAPNARSIAARRIPGPDAGGAARIGGAPRSPAPQRAPGMEPQPGGARSCRRGAPGGACELGPAAEAAPMSLAIHSTTGTRYDLSVPPDETVEGLRKRLSQRLKVPKERLALLHRDTRLSSGKLREFGVGDGSKLTLVPTVEAGLMSQASRPEQSVVQALESLTETQPPAAPGPGRAGRGGFRKYRFILFKHPWHRQGPQSPERGGERPQVSDFLSGRSPLTLALRVGDHMMFVQLQLAAQHTPLQHRHVLAAAAAAAAAARGDPSIATPVASPCRPVSGAARVPPVPASPPPTPVTAGSFRSHAASAACPEQVDCSPAASSSASPGASTSSPPGGSPAARARTPGAVIESFVNHAPGVFSGTFSGTLHPNCQDSSGRPRRDIGTILQILNDLLSATRQYQGVPPSLSQLRCHAQCAPGPPSPDLAPKTTSAPPAALLQGQSQIRMCKPPGDRLRQTENRATRCKVERLQVLLQQRRMRRKARRDARGPYHWPPSRKASSGGGGGGGGGGSPGEAAGLGLDFEDSVWKPEVNPDIKSEFVVA